MEYQKIAGKSMTKILKFLPRATSSVTFQNPPIYSPSKDKKPSEKPYKSNLGIGFSGPMMSIVSSKTHRKIKNESSYTLVYEPTSPRVSCMGQVKCKHYRRLTSKVTNKQSNKFTRSTSYTAVRTYKPEEDQEKVVKIDPVVEKSKKKSGIMCLFKKTSRRKPDVTENMSKTALTIPKAPCLNTMKRFSSGRDAFMSFDWMAQVVPLDADHRSYSTTDGEEVAIPSSAPVMVRNKGVCDGFIRVGGVKMEPRKEINLWKRRTMAQPQPLLLHAAN